MKLPSQQKQEEKRPPQTGVSDKKKLPHIFNAQGYGKAGNNAIDIMVAQGYFNGKETDLDTVLAVYSELTKAIYKTDVETIEELKREMK